MTSTDGFYDAKTARDIAAGNKAGNTVVLAEINALQVAVDTAAAANALETTVVNLTTMTQTAIYYEAWADPSAYQTAAHKLATIRMNQVINYFTRLGYQITREREDVADRISWIIRW